MAIQAQAVSKIGNLTRTPELRYSESGKAYVRVGLAWRPYVPEGEPEPETDFYEIVAFGYLAEHAAETLHKGDRVVVVGVGELEEWTDRDGRPRTTKKIIADGLGPDLRFATATVHRSERGAARQPQHAAPEPQDGTGEEPF